MTELGITITELVEDGQPPSVRCEFVDAVGRSHALVEKLAIVSAADSLPVLPGSAGVACLVVDVRAEQGGRRVVRVDLGSPYGCETVAGETVVAVFDDQLRASDEVWIAVDGARVPAAMVGTNEGLNYGQLDGLETAAYQAALPLACLDWFGPAFVELVEELREDDRQYAVDDPSEFAAIGYPRTLREAAQHPELLAKALATYADRDLLGHHFPFVEATAKFVINSTESVWVIADQVVIRGRCWVRPRG